jgi:hypothetical protein
VSIFLLIGATVMEFTRGNSRDSARSRSRVQTHANAEGGIAAGLSRIHYSVENTNPFNSTILPSSRDAAMAENGQPVQYENGYAYYWGTIDALTGEWTVYSEAHETNPNGGSDIVRNVTAKLQVQRVTEQAETTNLWNWIYAKHEGYTCDMTIQNPGDVVTNVWVEGNLCVENTARLMGDQVIEDPSEIGPTVVVEGNLTLRNPKNEVGSPTERVNVGIGGWCVYQPAVNLQHDPCQGPLPVPDADHVYANGTSTNLEDVLAGIVGFAPIVEPTWPTPEWDEAYLNASPGPYYPCAQSSGTPPTFDNDQGSIATASASHMNGSAGTVLLTPNQAYTCRTAGGELSWTPGTGGPGTLTVSGTIFIDGNAEILNNTLVDYNGQAAIYVQGDLLMRKATVCAVFLSDNSGCDNAPWDPNDEFLLFVVSAQAYVGDEDIEIKSTKFQGGLMASNDIVVETTSQMAGPMLGDYLFVGQTASTTFPHIDEVGTGTPGTPIRNFTATPVKIYG